MTVAAADQERLMRRVLELARAATASGAGLPFGAVVVREADGQIVGEAHNEVLASVDPTAHAELLAVRRACRAVGAIDLSGCTMYTNVAPCCMCMSSVLWAHLDQVYYLLGMEASDTIGLGDMPFYDELSRPLAERVITPVTMLPFLQDDAYAVVATASGPIAGRG
jgi:guanine deaminase